MDRYRSPQPVNPAALSIGTPRPLRPRGADERTIGISTPATRQHVPLHYTPVIPTPMLSEQSYLPTDEYGVLQSPYRPQGAELVEGPSEALEDGQRSSRRGGRGFVGAFMSGLRRIPRTMEKHHSRQSLYEEYLAEAEEAASVQHSQMMSPNPSRPLDGIPEYGEGEVVESQRGQSSQDTYDDGTTAVHHDIRRPTWPINSPTYTNSELNSLGAKAESSVGPLPPDDTWAYYYARILLFIDWLWKLPWSEARIVNDYVPSRDGRGQFGQNRPVNNWYKPRQKNPKAVDNEKSPQVLIVPATPPTGSVLSSHHGYGVAPLPPPPTGLAVIPSPWSDGATTAIRPTHTPMTATSAGLPYASPGMSSHGMGRHELSFSWYSSSPQRWPSYFPEMSSPQTQTRLGTDYYGSPPP